MDVLLHSHQFDFGTYYESEIWHTKGNEQQLNKQNTCTKESRKGEVEENVRHTEKENWTEIKGVFLKGQKFVWPCDAPLDASKQIFKVYV